MQSRWLGISSVAAVLALTFALSGCGGGSGNGGSEMSISDKWQRFQAGNPTLRMTGAQIEQALDSRGRRASHELIWSLAGPVGGQQQIVVEVEPNEYEDSSQLPPGSTLSFAPVLEHDGVPIAEVKVRVVYEDEDDGETYLLDTVTYQGWLDHTGFGVGFSALCNVDAPGCSGTSPVYGWGFADGSTPLGVYPGTSPAGMGSATWTGVMVGMESPEFGEHEAAAALAWAREGRPDVYLGDARISIEDLAAPDVDVSFTGIRNVTEGTRHRDMSWEGLSVVNGLFGGGGSDDYVAGMFTGPRHQEVGGEFRRDGIAGGFGAKRR